MVKRLKYIGQCLEELSSLAITGTDDTNPAAAYTALGDQITLRAVVSPEAVRAGRRFQQQFLEELPGLMVRPGEALRHHLAWYGPHHVSSSVSSSMWSDDIFLHDQVHGIALIMCHPACDLPLPIFKIKYIVQPFIMCHPASDWTKPIEWTSAAASNGCWVDRSKLVCPGNWLPDKLTAVV